MCLCVVLLGCLLWRCLFSGAREWLRPAWCEPSPLLPAPHKLASPEQGEYAKRRTVGFNACDVVYDTSEEASTWRQAKAAERN
eukprot:COSAG06_NODE_36393_length_447_cov_1.747126_1_plen_82_part_01